MIEQMKQSVVLFTDGACKGNPGPGGWGCIALFPDGQVTEVGGKENGTTNNRMEMTAVVQGFELCHATEAGAPVMVFTDSSYVIQGMSSWIFGWIRKGWKTSAGKDVLNQDLWKELHRLSEGLKVSYHHVKGHAGIPGNERADKIASDFAEFGAFSDLYRGNGEEYVVDLYQLDPGRMVDSPAPSKGARKSGAGGHYYISFVDGHFKRHQTWPDCQQATNGRSGARFKKVRDQQEEQTVLKSWGCQG